MKYLLLFLLLFLVSCGFTKFPIWEIHRQQPLINIQDTLKPNSRPKLLTYPPLMIKYGEVKFIESESMKVGFVEVISDSRCPLNVVCKWGGRADIQIWYSTFPLDTISIKLSLLRSQEPTYTDTLGYRFQLIHLEPYPIAGIDRDSSDYTAYLNVFKF
ncbi:MAG: hypothetical protein KG003_14205 [Bacteroidetes bacterium]|nr:hypothetical protein [Bacteroidota bacterium]